MRLEALLFLALFVLIALLIAAARWILREIEQSERKRDQEAASYPGEPISGPETVPDTSLPEERQPERRSSRMTRLRTAARRNVLTHPSTPKELRRGMVLMTILGPCRGLEPWERSEAAQLGLNPPDDERSQSIP